MSKSLDRQAQALAFLADPASHGPGVGEVERIETHGAFVFLAGDRVYKVKREVKYPYLDFSTLELRRIACEREVELNRRTAPALYLGTEAVRRAPDGALTLGGDGPAVEWAVEMRRFSQAQLLDRIAERGALSQGLIRDLADEVARFHAAAEPVGQETTGGDGAEAFTAVLSATLEELAEDEPLFDPEEVTAYRRAALAAVAAQTPLLDRRARAGRVRRCHGDLHLRNIVLQDDRPLLFDCIEFNDAMACIDVLYDLAFLLMDLQHRGHRPEANLLLNRYLQRSGEAAGALAALPLFQSLRAAIRAKVGATAAGLAEGAEHDAKAAEAGDYLALARRLLATPEPSLAAVGGRSGSGKSRLATALAPDLGAAPGALHLRSDVIRKELCGVDERTRLPKTAYDQTVTQRVYATLLERAGAALAAGHGVIADAAFLGPDERGDVEELARAHGVAFHGLWLEAPERVLAERVAARSGDASDADQSVVRLQAELDVGAVSWVRIDASAELRDVIADGRRALALSPTAAACGSRRPARRSCRPRPGSDS